MVKFYFALKYIAHKFAQNSREDRAHAHIGMLMTGDGESRPERTLAALWYDYAVTFHEACGRGGDDAE